MELKISRADVNDLPEILALQKLSFQENAARYNDVMIPPLKQTLDELIKDAETHVILKAVEVNGIIGSVRACLKGDYCYIGRLMVHPDYQNKGIGRKLLLAAEDEFDTAVFELDTGHLDDKNIALYRKLGYETYGTEKISGNLYFIHMRKLRGEHPFRMNKTVNGGFRS